MKLSYSGCTLRFVFQSICVLINLYFVLCPIFDTALIVLCLHLAHTVAVPVKREAKDEALKETIGLVLEAIQSTLIHLVRIIFAIFIYFFNNLNFFWKNV